MPDHSEVRAFTQEMGEYLPDHDVLKEVEDSRVAMLAEDENTWVPKLEKSSEFWQQDALVDY
jgi:tRNA wybutosine-synthesizing protein 1